MGRYTLRVWLMLALIALIVLLGLSVVSANRLLEQHRLDRELISAVKRNDAATVERLLKQGANANAQDNGGRRFTLWTLLRDRLQGKMPSTQPGPPALAVAIDWPDTQDDAPDNSALIRALLDHGANPNIVMDHGTAALSYTILLGQRKTVDLLLGHGAKVDGVGSDGFTSLMAAALDDDPERLKMLLGRGANIEAADAEGNTALYYALISSPECLHILLAQHANPNARNLRGETLRSIARHLIATGSDADASAEARELLNAP